jgi:hypothetical protein
MRKDSILQQYYYKKLPKYQGAGQVPIQRKSLDEQMAGLKSAQQRTSDSYTQKPADLLKVAEANRQKELNARREKQGEIRAAGPKQSTASRALAIAANPMTALKYKLKGQDIPENFERGEINPYEHAVNMINPFGYINAAVSIPGNVAKGEFLQAGLNAASVLPMLGEFRGLKVPFVNSMKSAALPKPSSSISITRGPINWQDEPNFVKKITESFPGRKIDDLVKTYLNDVGKFGKASYKELPKELEPKIIRDMSKEEYGKYTSGLRKHSRDYWQDLNRPTLGSPSANKVVPKQAGFLGDVKQMFTDPKQYFTKPGESRFVPGGTQYSNKFQVVKNADGSTSHIEFKGNKINTYGSLNTGDENWHIVNKFTAGKEGRKPRDIMNLVNDKGEFQHFYKSSGTNSGKSKGAWYPYEGQDMGGWFIKGNAPGEARSYEIYPEIDPRYGKGTEQQYKLSTLLEDQYPHMSGTDPRIPQNVPYGEELYHATNYPEYFFKGKMTYENPVPGNPLGGYIQQTAIPQYRPKFSFFNPEQGIIQADKWVEGPRKIDWSKVGKTAAGVGIGTGLLSAGYNAQKKKQGGVIKDNRGQWAHPGKITEIQGNTMATHGYGDIPLYVVPDVGESRVINPNTGNHTFPGATKFTEYPLNKAYGGPLADYYAGKMNHGEIFQVGGSNAVSLNLPIIKKPNENRINPYLYAMQPDFYTNILGAGAQGNLRLNNRFGFTGGANITNVRVPIAGINQFQPSFSAGLNYHFKNGGSVNPRQPLSLDAVIRQNRRDRDSNSYSGGISKFAEGGQANRYYYNKGYGVPTFNNGGDISTLKLPKAQTGKDLTTQDSVRHQAGKILSYEQLRGGPGGAPLPEYADSKYMNMLMNKIYPEVKKIMPNASAMESAEAMDFIFNSGRDPRIYMLDQYLKSKGQEGIPNRGSFNIDMNKEPGKWAKKKPELDAIWNQYSPEINKLPANTRRQFLNRGRDWYYQNINNPAPGVPNSDYYDTWYGRIWNTNDFNDFNPNNPKFKPQKRNGGDISIPQLPEKGGPLLQYYYKKGGVKR